MLQFPQLFFYMSSRIPCTCGCGLKVTYATKRNDLNARGTTSIRARVETETKSLKKNTKKNTQQQQKPTPLQKRASSNPDQDGSRKRHKAAQIEETQLPEIIDSSQEETDMVEDLLPPVATYTGRQSVFIERSQGVMEMRWTTSRRDGGFHSDGRDDGDEEKDEDKDEDEDEDEDASGKTLLLLGQSKSL